MDQQVQLYLHEALKQFAGQYREALNKMAATNRLVASKAEGLEQQVQDLSAALSAMKVSRNSNGGSAASVPGLLYVDDIPGKREPYTFLVDIPIGANDASSQKASFVIDQSGPFICTKRWATFQSAYQFSTTDPTSGQVGRFVGRSFGRYRPVHSAWDISDGQNNGVADTAFWWLSQLLTLGSPTGTALPGAVLGLPSNMSSFRSMEFDGRIRVIVSGSSSERQNIPVPTSLWTSGINAAVDLGALDFLERGDAVTFEIQPNHVNNPPAGNVTGTNVFPAVAGLGASAGFPFLEGQYDAHEGVATPGGTTKNINGNATLPALLTADSVARLPNGIITIGFEGYRIRQPIGPVG